jgi:hypothetical protein
LNAVHPASRPKPRRCLSRTLVQQPWCRCCHSLNDIALAPLDFSLHHGRNIEPEMVSAIGPRPGVRAGKWSLLKVVRHQHVGRPDTPHQQTSFHFTLHTQAMVRAGAECLALMLAMPNDVELEGPELTFGEMLHTQTVDHTPTHTYASPRTRNAQVVTQRRAPAHARTRHNHLRWYTWRWPEPHRQTPTNTSPYPTLVQGSALERKPCRGARAAAALNLRYRGFCPCRSCIGSVPLVRC